MPEIAGTGDNWFISHHQEGYVEVLEVALPSNRRVKLEYIDGGEHVVLKVLVREEDLTERRDLTERWEAIAEFERRDVDGVASLFFAAHNMLRDDEAKRDWRPWHWFKRVRKDRRRGGDDECSGELFGALGSSGVGFEPSDDGVRSDAGGGGGDPQDERSPSTDGPEAT